MVPNVLNEHTAVCCLQVTLSEAPVLDVTLDCVSCLGPASPRHISFTDPVILTGRCGQCDDQTQVIVLIWVRKGGGTNLKSHSGL